MNKILSLTFLVVCSLLTHAQQSFPFYPDSSIPFAKPGGEIPQLTVFPPANTAKRTKIAVVVCSGGSYRGRANPVEGTPAAQALAASGITAFLLDYRVPDAERMENKSWVPLTDAQQALRYVREHAKQYKIDPAKVGIMGFSAGGHLVSTVATHFTENHLANSSATSVKPAFAVLVYPVISFADSLTHWRSRENLIGPDFSDENIRHYSNELQVTVNTPPCYIVHAVDDDVVKVENALYFEAALRQHNVPVEIFLYAKGGHGFGINNTQAKVQWIDDCIGWIKSQPWRK